MLQLPILSKSINQYTHPTADFKCRRAPTAAEWEAIRPTFTDLYRFQGYTLPRVTQILQQNHGFGATPKMYKDKIALWGLTKYTKKDDMKRLLRIKREYESAGKPCALLLKGFIVDAAALERRSKRALGREVHALAEEAADTDDNLLVNSGLQLIEFSTSVGVIDDPEVFSLVQKVLYYTILNLEKYITTYCRDFADGIGVFSISDWLRNIDAGVGYCNQADFVTGGIFIRHGFAMLADRCQVDGDAFHVDLEQLARYTVIWSCDGRSDIVRLLLEFLAQVSKLHITQTHPQRVLLETLDELQRLETEVPLKQLTQSLIRSSLPKWLPPSHSEILWYDYLRAIIDDSFDALTWIESIDDKHGMSEQRAWDLVDWCSNEAHHYEDWALLESLWSFYLVHAADDFDFMIAHVYLAYSQSQLGDDNAATRNLQEAYGSCSDWKYIASAHSLFLGHLPVLRWIYSISSDDHGILQLQTALRECGDRIARLDEQECMET